MANTKLKIKKGDQVVVLTGRDKGTKGEVLKVLTEERRVTGIYTTTDILERPGGYRVPVLHRDVPVISPHKTQHHTFWVSFQPHAHRAAVVSM
mgnify:CR=1 FL=1